MGGRQERGTGLARWVAALALLIAAGAARPAGADRALVVGVDRYAALPVAACPGGAVNDARAMAASLRRHGFRVSELYDRAASRRGILEALAALRRKTGPGDRFVFYFAGLGGGTAGRPASLLPADARPDSDARDLDSGTLSEAVRAVPSRARTLILDAGLGRDDGLPSLPAALRVASRRFLRPGDALPNPVQPGAGTAMPTFGDRAEAVRFYAGRGDDPACELERDRKRQGAFTAALTRALDRVKPGDEPLSWQRLQAQVTGEVARATNGGQRPVLAAEAPTAPVFDRVASKTVDTRPWSAWDLLNADRPDPEALALTMRPDRTELQVGETTRLEVKAGRAGFLVVLEYGTSGRLWVQFPESLRVEDAAVQAGQTVRIPDPDTAFSPDEPGREYLKALLFADRAQAERLLRAFGANGINWRSERAFREGEVPGPPPVTADRTVRIR